MRKNCHKLYDYMWESVKQIRSNRLLKTDNELTNFNQKLKSRNVVSDEVFIETKQEKIVKDFTSFFTYWYKNYSERYYTCSKFVRASNINHDLDRHWFFTYMTMYIKLEKMGNVFNCPRRAWFINPLKLDNTRSYDPEKERGKCDDEDLDRAFDTAINQLSGLMQKGSEYFKYIEYNNVEGGSHEKIYSFVNFTGKRMQCANKKENERPSTGELYPRDVEWRPFGVQYENKDDKSLIR